MGCQNFPLTSTALGSDHDGMAGSRDVFPLRFKNPHTRGALKFVAEQTGRSMTDIAEQAIEHEVALLGSDLERRLEEALDVVRSYRPEVDLDSYIHAAAAGERSDLEPMREVGAAHDDPFGVRAAFHR